MASNTNTQDHFFGNQNPSDPFSSNGGISGDSILVMSGGSGPANESSLSNGSNLSDVAPLSHSRHPNLEQQQQQPFPQPVAASASFVVTGSVANHHHHHHQLHRQQHLPQFFNDGGLSPLPQQQQQQQQRQQQIESRAISAPPPPSMNNNASHFTPLPQQHQQTNSSASAMTMANVSQLQQYQPQQSTLGNSSAPQNNTHSNNNGNPNNNNNNNNNNTSMLMMTNNSSNHNHNNNNNNNHANSSFSSSFASPTAADKIEHLRLLVAEERCKTFRLQTDLDVNQRVTSEQQHRIHQLDGEKNQLTRLAESLRDDRKKLEQKLDDVTKEARNVVGQWQAELAKFEQVAQKESSRAAVLSSQLESAESRVRELTAAASRTEVVEREASTERSLRQQAENERDLLNTKIGGLERHLSTCQGTLRSQEIAIANLQKESEHKSKEIHELNESLLASKKEVAALRTQRDEWRTSSSELETQTAQLRQKLQVVFEGKDKLQDDCDKIKRVVHDLEQSLESERSELTRAVKAVSECDGRLATTKSLLDREQHESATARSTIDELRHLYSQSQRKEIELAARVDEDKICLDDLTNTNRDLARRNGDLHQEVAQLQSALDHERKSASTAMSDYRSRIEQLNADVTTIRAKLEDARAEADRHKNSLLQRERECDELRDTIDEQRDSIQTLTSAIKSMEEQSEGVQASMAELDDELQRTLKSKEELDRQLLDSAGTVSRLEGQLREAAMNLDRARSQHALALSDLQKKFNDQSNDRATSLEDAVRKAEAARKETEDGLRDQLGHLKSKFADEAKKCHDLGSAAEAMKTELIRFDTVVVPGYKKKVADLEAALSDVRVKLAESGAVSQAAESQRSQDTEKLKTELEAAAKRHADADAVARALQGKISEAVGRAARAEASLEFVEKENDGLKKQLHDVKSEVKVVKQELESQKREAASATSALVDKSNVFLQREGEMKQQLEHAVSEVASFRSQNERLNSQLNVLMSETKQQRENFEKKQDELNELRQLKEETEVGFLQHVRNLESDVAKALQERDEVERQLRREKDVNRGSNALSDRITKLERDLVSSQNEVTRLNSTLTMSERMRNQLREQLSTNNNNNNKTNSSNSNNSSDGDMVPRSRLSDCHREIESLHIRNNEMQTIINELPIRIKQETEAATRKKVEREFASILEQHKSDLGRAEAQRQQLQSDFNEERLKRTETKKIVEECNRRLLRQSEIAKGLLSDREEALRERDLYLSKLTASSKDHIHTNDAASSTTLIISNLQQQNEKLQSQLHTSTEKLDDIAALCKKQKNLLEMASKDHAALQALLLMTKQNNKHHQANQRTLPPSSSSTSAAVAPPGSLFGNDPFGMMNLMNNNNNNNNNNNYSTTAPSTSTSSSSVSSTLPNQQPSLNLQPVNFNEGPRRKPQKRSIAAVESTADKVKLQQQQQHRPGSISSHSSSSSSRADSSSSEEDYNTTKKPMKMYRNE